MAKRYDSVQNLNWGEVRKHYEKDLVEQFGDINSQSGVDLSRFKPLRGDTVVLSKFCNVPAAKRAKLARHSRQARERGVVSEEGIFKLVNISDKMQVVSRQKKYRAMSDSLTEYIS